MSWGLPFITPKQLEPITLADALMGGIKFAQQTQNNKLVNQGKGLENEKARVNLKTLDALNNARLNSINSLTNLHNMSSRLINNQIDAYPLQNENDRLRNEELRGQLNSKKNLAERLSTLSDAFSGKDLSDKRNQYALAAQLAGIDPKEAVSLLGSLNKPVNNANSLTPYQKVQQQQEAKENEAFESNASDAKNAYDLASQMENFANKTPDYQYVSSGSPALFGLQTGFSDNFKNMEAISKNLAPLIRSIKNIPQGAMRTKFEQQMLSDMALSPRGQSKASHLYQIHLMKAAAKQSMDLQNAYQQYKKSHAGSGEGFRNSEEYNKIINRPPPPSGALTENAIKDTMKATGMTRDQVIAEYNKRMGQ